MDLFSRNLPRVHPETQVSGLKSQPRQLSRVNGWSLPLHPFQAVVWATYLVLSVVTFGIVIPLLPSTWKYISYSVSFFLVGWRWEGGFLHWSPRELVPWALSPHLCALAMCPQVQRTHIPL